MIIDERSHGASWSTSSTMCVCIATLCIAVTSCTGPVSDVMNDIVARNGAYPHAVSEQQVRYSDDSLYAIMVDGRVGYVDFNGAVVIRPRFHAAGQFSCGLARAREHGRYGYIDANGNWAISPRFDFATDFSEGIAAGYINGTAYILDRQGSVIHQGAYDEVEPFHDGLAVVHYNYETGLINREGEVIVEPGNTHYNILDSTRIITREYIEARPPRHGYWSTTGKLINHHGRLLRTFDNYQGVAFTYSAPIFLLNKHVYNLSGGKVGEVDTLFVGDDGRFLKSGFIHGSHFVVTGETGEYKPRTLDNKFKRIKYGADYATVCAFSDSLLVAHDTTTKTLDVFNTVGGLRKLSSTPVSYIEPYMVGHHSREVLWGDNYQYPGDFAVLETPKGRRVIDGAGRISSPLQITEFSEVVFIENARVIIAMQDTRGADRKLLFFDWTGSELPRAQYSPVEEVLSIRNGVITAIIGERLMLIDLGGRILWQSEENALNKVSVTDFDYKPHVDRRPYPADGAKSWGGWDSYMVRSGNWSGEKAPQPLMPEIFTRELKQNGLVLDPFEPIQVFALTISSGKKDTFDVVMANTRADSVRIGMTMNRMLLMEVRRNSSEPWVEIEQPGRIQHGANYYTVTMPGLTRWTYRVTRYSGEEKVECRMKLAIGTDESGEYGHIPRGLSYVYSNTFTLSVNPGQMWRRNPYVYEKRIIEPQ